MTHLVVLVFPCAMFPETLHDVGLVLKELRITIFRGQFARHLTIDHVATTLHHHPTALEVFRTAVLLLILALRVCAHLNDCY